MKTLHVSLILGICLIGLSFGCQKKVFQEKSPIELVLKIKNHPSVGKIELDLKSVDFFYSENENQTADWINAETPLFRKKHCSFDEDVMSSLKEYPVGRISRIRVKLGDKNQLTDAYGNMFSLSKTSEGETYAFLECNVFVKHDKNYQMEMMLDVQKSVFKKQTGEIMFNPIFEMDKAIEF